MAESEGAQRVIMYGDLAGAVVFFHFINSSGHADCRFAEDFGPHKKGEIVVVPWKNLGKPGGTANG